MIEARLTLDLEDLHSLSTLVSSDKLESSLLAVGLLEPLDHLGVDLVSVTVPLPHGSLPAIQPSDLCVLGRGLKDGRTQTQSHGPSKVRLGDLGHEDDRGRGAARDELGRVGVLDATDVSGPLDDGDLHPEADSEVRDLVLSRPLASDDHTLRTSHSETSRDQDTTEERSESGWLAKGKGCEQREDRTHPAEQRAFQASWYLTGSSV